MIIFIKRFKTIFIILFIYFTLFSICENIFLYENNNPKYPVGFSIDINKPKYLINGKYKIIPNFKNGLIFNNSNGFISGIANIECNDDYLVEIYTKNITYQSILHIISIILLF